MNKKLISVILLLVMLILQTTPALAVEDPVVSTTEPMISAEQPTTSTEPSTTPPIDETNGDDTPATETPPETPETDFTATTAEELLQAIEQAESGDTIGVGCIIQCMDETVLGIPNKVVTIRRTAPEGAVAFSSDTGTGIASVQNIIFDGAEIESVFSFVVSNVPSTFINCSFVNCFGGDGAGLYLTGRNTMLTGCAFDNNKGARGSHLRIDGGTVSFLECNFTNGTATMKGGAIFNLSDREVSMVGCTITNNTAAQHGGGIWNCGEMSISQSKIFNNTANGNADDIVSEYRGRLALMDDHAALTALFAPDGLIPNKWTVDTFTEDTSDPAAYSNIVFSMSFSSSEEPDPEPTPEPEPEPAPDPVIIYKTIEKIVTVPEPEADPVIMTNGKAVLKAPEALYWDGYELGHGKAGGTVTRGDLAALMVSLMDEDSMEAYWTETAPFDDVGPGCENAPAIGTANSAGIMVGCGLGAFHPERELTWGELITVLTRFTDEETPPMVYMGDHWAKDAINIAISLGWIDYTEAFDPGEPITCGDMITLIQGAFLWASE